MDASESPLLWRISHDLKTGRDGLMLHGWSMAAAPVMHCWLFAFSWPFFGIKEKVWWRDSRVNVGKPLEEAAISPICLRFLSEATIEEFI